MNASLPLPLDVRLMNFTTALMASGLVLAALAALLWWGLRNPVFAIGQITVTGDTQHNSAASLRAVALPRLAGNFFTLDLDEARAAFEAAPWVRKAVVRREFPNRLVVELQEHVPVARWGEGDSDLVDAAGVVFDTGGAGGGDDEAGELPLLLGPDGQAPEVLAMYRALVPAMRPLDSPIATLELQPRGHWRAELAAGTEIELGQGEPAELAPRLARFAATAGEVAARYRRGAEAIESADLRHNGGYALRLRGVATGGEQPANKGR